MKPGMKTKNSLKCPSMGSAPANYSGRINGNILGPAEVTPDYKITVVLHTVTEVTGRWIDRQGYCQGW
jgi:hypothetical protein